MKSFSQQQSLSGCKEESIVVRQVVAFLMSEAEHYGRSAAKIRFASEGIHYSFEVAEGKKL